MHRKKLTALILCLIIIFTFCSCGGEVNLAGVKEKPIVSSAVTLDLLAPEEALAPVITLIEKFRSVDSGVSIRVNFDDGVMCAEKLLSGYSCDIIIDYTTIMDQIDGSSDQAHNPYGFSAIDSASRRDVFYGPADEERFGEDDQIYSAAIPNSCQNNNKAQNFIDFLLSDTAKEVYEEYGFTGIQE